MPDSRTEHCFLWWCIDRAGYQAHTGVGSGVPGVGALQLLRRRLATGTGRIVDEFENAT